MHFSKSLVRIICSFSGIPFVVQLLEYQVLFNLLASAAAAEISYLRTRQQQRFGCFHCEVFGSTDPDADYY